jgi:hypothetical protein
MTLTCGKEIRAQNEQTCRQSHRGMICTIRTLKQCEKKSYKILEGINVEAIKMMSLLSRFITSK